MTKSDYDISRRTLLRGAGVTIALPWLESISAWGDEAKDKTTEPPVRMACLFA